MYVDPFWYGVLCTVTSVSVALIVLALYMGRRK